MPNEQQQAPSVELDVNERILLAAFQREAEENVGRPVRIEIDWGIAWALLATVQLACRHPGFRGPTRGLIEGFGRELQQMVSVGPASEMVAEQGWHREYDTPEPEEESCRP